MRYFEDFHVGEVIDLGTTSASEEEIIAFAKQFDPQPFHISPAQAKSSPFGGLIASGWHTVSLVMRLLVDIILNDTISLASPGVDEVRWLKPLRPGDTLRARFTVLETTTSRSRAELGIVKSKIEAFNQREELVMSMVGIHFLGRMPAETSTGSGS